MAILFFLHAKRDGSLRLLFDFHSLNANTHLDQYPIPCIDELLDRLSGNCVFSSLDLQCGYPSNMHSP